MVSKLEADSIPAIRERLKTILHAALAAFKFLAACWAKFMYLSIFFVITDAMRFMRKYYSDDEFNNTLVDKNLKKLWKFEGSEKLTPLRKWERKIFQIAKSTKLTRKEVKKIFMKAIPTLAVILFASTTCLVDYGFYAVGSMLNSSFTITFIFALNAFCFQY